MRRFSSVFIFYVSCLALCPVLAHATTGTITYTSAYQSQFGSLGTGNAQFDDANDVLRLADGRYVVVDRFANPRIEIFDANGNYITDMGTGVVAQPINVQLDANGNIVVSDLSYGAIYRFDPNTYANIGVTGGLNSPHGMIVVGSDLYVVSIYGHEINILDSAGNVTSTFGTADLNFPHNIAADSSGNLYVTEFGLGEVKVFNAAHTLIGSFGSGILSYPVGITTDSHDNVYVVDSGNSRIAVFDKNGNLLTTFGSQGTGNGQFYWPRGIYVDDNGNISVSEGVNFNDFSRLNNRVQTFVFSSLETFSTSPGTGDQSATTANAGVKLTNSGTFDDDFLGYQDLIVDGTSWTLGGNNTFDDSVTLVNGALTVGATGSITSPIFDVQPGTTLIVDGTLNISDPTHDLEITPSSALAGSGHINGDVVIDGGGAIAPGTNSIATLTINGAYTHANGAFYQVDVNAAGQSDRIAASNATLNGGTVFVHAAGGSYNAATNYTILSTTGNITGTYGGVTSNLAFLTPSLIYNANSVQLRLLNNNATFNTYAETPNQKSTSAALDNLFASTTGDSAAVKTALLGLNTDEARQALDQIAPNEIASLQTINRQFSQRLDNLVMRRLQVLSETDKAQFFDDPVFTNLNGIATAAGGEQHVDKDHYWFQGALSKTLQDGDTNAVGATSFINAWRGGIDVDVSPRLVVGFSPGYAHGTVRFRGENDRAETDYYRADLYALYHTGPWSFSTILGGGMGRQETERAITVGGLNRQAKGETLTKDLSLQASADYYQRLNDNAYVQPGLTATFSVAHQNSFTENGASSLDLHYDGQNDAYVQLHPKVTVGKFFAPKNRDFVVNPYVGGGVILQSGSQRPKQTASFTAVPDDLFSVTGPRNSPIAVDVDLGVTFSYPKDAAQPASQLHYTGVFSRTEATHALVGSFVWNF